jgi:uncharacterized membrane protein
MKQGPEYLTRRPHASRRRSVAKALTWRTLGSLDTFAVSYFLTGQAQLGVFIASAEVLTKMALYYFHERAWARIHWALE